MREILHWPDPRRQQYAAPAGSSGPPAALIGELFDTMCAAPARGLAASQIGVMARVFVMDAGWKAGRPTPIAIIDPEIVARSDALATTEEACLSIPGVTATITRPARITLHFRDPDGATVTRTFEGFQAACAQDEIDHRDRRVIFDRLARSARARAEADYAKMA